MQLQQWDWPLGERNSAAASKEQGLIPQPVSLASVSLSRRPDLTRGKDGVGGPRATPAGQPPGPGAEKAAERH